MILIENIKMNFPLPKRYKDYIFRPFQGSEKFIALKNINLLINAGDRVAFLGINGAGKTTLLKLIGGLLYPSCGNITIDSFDTMQHNLKARKAVGFVLNEERSFYWRLTGRQNLEFFGNLDNITGFKLNNKVEELLNLVGLGKGGDKLVATYSSGMKQRLAIARGLLSDPQILILDEPTRALDPAAVEDVKTLIAKNIHEDVKRTLLIATHRFDEAEALCNKVCVMRCGEVLAFNSIKDIKTEFGSVADYYHHVMAEREAVLV